MEVLFLLILSVNFKIIFQSQYKLDFIPEKRSKCLIFKTIKHYYYMKKIAATGFFTCLTLLSFSQQNTVSTGGEASGSGGTVSYSVGQIDYTNSLGSNGSVNQGVQQPYEFYELGIKEAYFVNVSLFPNPSNEYIILQFENLTNDLSYALYDLNGKIVVEGIVEAIETQIDMRTFATGQYNLAIKNATNNIQSIKIIKN